MEGPRTGRAIKECNGEKITARYSKNKKLGDGTCGITRRATSRAKERQHDCLPQSDKALRRSSRNRAVEKPTLRKRKSVGKTKAPKGVVRKALTHEAKQARTRLTA